MRFFCIFTQKAYFCTKILLHEKNKLIEARKNRDYSQEYMAVKLEMNPSSYCRKEKGEIKISTIEWEKIAKLFKVPIEDIFEADESMIFIFNDSSSGVGNGIGNTVTNYTIPQSVWDLQKKYIEKLEEELRNKNEECRLLKEKIGLLKGNSK